MACKRLTYQEDYPSIKVVHRSTEILSNSCTGYYMYGFNGMEKDDEVSGSGNSYTAEFWQYDSRLGRRWNQDPKPNPSISNYACFANNPIFYSDVYGDTVRVEHKRWGKTRTLTYDGGTFYKQNGKEYKGSTRGFLGQVEGALSDINSTDVGSGMLDELVNSANVFTIKQTSGGSEFLADDKYKAEAERWKTDPKASLLYDYKKSNGVDFEGGSGGTIFWNPNGTSLPEQGGMVNRPNIILGHEMFHAQDANNGMIDKRPYLHDKVSSAEWQAVYKENLMRQQMGIPLRTHYIKGTYDNKTFFGAGPSMLDYESKPWKPLWLK